MIDLRPLTLGELVDRAFALWRAQWKRIFPLIFAFQLVSYAITKATLLLGQTYLPAFFNGSKVMQQAMKDDPVGSMTQAAAGSAAMGVMMFIVLWLSTLSGIAVTHVLHPVALGQPAPPLAAAARHAVSRLARATGAWVLAVGWTCIFSGLLMLPGVLIIAAGTAASASGDHSAIGIGIALVGALLMMLGGLVGFLWSLVRFSLLSQVLCLEERGAWGTMVRCGQLSSGSVAPGLGGLVKLRLAVLITLLGILITLVSQVMAVPVYALHGIYGNGLDLQNMQPQLIPPYLLVPAELLQHAGMAVLTPVYVAFQVLFYLDMRVRREGLDLQLKLDASKASAA